MACKYCNEDHGCDNPGCDDRSLKAEIDRLRSEADKAKSRLARVLAAIHDDAWSLTHQSVGQYRSALIKLALADQHNTKLTGASGSKSSGPQISLA